MGKMLPLEAMGIKADPLDLLFDTIKVGLLVQLAAAAALFYGTELLGHQDVGDAFRCAAGLYLGFWTRAGAAQVTRPLPICRAASPLWSAVPLPAHVATNAPHRTCRQPADFLPAFPNLLRPLQPA